MWLVVGLSGCVGDLDVEYWRVFSVLEEAREEDSLVQVLQASLAVVFEFGRHRSSPKYLVPDEVRRVLCSLYVG